MITTQEKKEKCDRLLEIAWNIITVSIKLTSSKLTSYKTLRATHMIAYYSAVEWI